MSELITPQLFGAKADGITDDTEAFQKAVDSGYDVYVPTAHRETYRITRPIRITKAQCKRIYSEPVPRVAEKGSIILDLNGLSTDPKTVPLFDVRIQLLIISGLHIISKVVNGSRAGILVNAMDDSVCDYDLRIEQCHINRFYKIAAFTGRGFEIANCKIGSCQYLADLYWDDAKDSNSNHPAKFDQRGISVKNCRIHHIVSGFLNVKSGHAYGLHFIGNTVDNGTGYLVRAEDQAFGWNISGNIIQGVHGSFDFMDFKKGMSNCLINGNTFLSDIGYWEGTNDSVKSWLNASGTSIASVVSNNVFKNSDGSFLTFKNLEGMAITGNVMRNKTSSTKPVITVTGTCQGNVITGNAVSSTKTVKLLSKQLSKDNSVTGNYPAA